MRRVIRKHLRDFVAIAVLAAIGVGTTAYILGEQGARIPFVDEDPFEIRAAFTDAGGVKPGQNQAVQMAGVRIGEIDDVELEDGRAVLTLAIEQRYADRIRRDATALLRPRTGLEDMFVDLAPGSEHAPAIEEDALIRIGDTLPDVDSEEVLNALDRRTRDYLKILINSGGDALDGHGTDVRSLFKRLEPLHRDLERVNSAFARQRRKLRRLVHDYGQLTTTLGREDEELERLVRASASVFDAFASQDVDLERAVARLPGTLRATELSLGRVDRFAGELGPALEALRPPFRRLVGANAALTRLARDTTPTVRSQIRPFIRRARPYLRTLRPGVTDLAAATPDLATSFGQLNRFFNMAAHNPGGAEPLSGDELRDAQRDEGYLFWVAWLAHTSNNLFSTSDAQGPFRRSNFALSCTTARQLVSMEPLVEIGLGLTALLQDTQLCPEAGGEPLIPVPRARDLAGKDGLG